MPSDPSPAGGPGRVAPALGVAALGVAALGVAALGAAALGAAVAPGGPGGSSRKSAHGAKNRPPVTAVEKSSIRSVLPGGLPMNMLTSISSVTDGVAA